MINIDIEKRLNAYQGRQLLQIKEDLMEGSITKIHGPSGAGKSTLLKIIAGFIAPDKGIIKVDNITWVDTGCKNLCYRLKKERLVLFSRIMRFFPI